MVLRESTNVKKQKKLWNQFLEENPGVYRNQNILGCKFCRFSMDSSNNNLYSDIERHKKLINHEKNWGALLESHDSGFINDEKHQADFLRILVVNNISFNVIDNPFFKIF